MAYQLNYQAESFLSVADLSASGPVFMSVDSTGRAVVSTATLYPEGILENQPVSGMPACVSYFGITKLTVDNSNITTGMFLAPNATGLGTDATAAGGYSQYARAIALEDSSHANDIITVRLIDANRAKVG